MKEKGENTIIVVDLQSDYCIDTTIKCGFEHGFHMIVPAYTNSSVDNEFMSGEKTYEYYNRFIWNKRYASCIFFEETLALINNKNLR